MIDISKSTALLISAILLTIPGGALGGIIFSENFDDGVADGFTVLGGEWEVVNGTYHAHTQGFEFWGISLAGSAEWGDYHFECDLYAEGSVNQVVWFRVFSPLHYYELVVRADPWNDAFLNKMINGNKVVLAYDPYYPNSPETWHHIQIDVVANEIMARFDEDLLFDIYDFSSPYLQGHIALASYSGGVIQWQDVFFDNVVVEVFVISNERQTWGQVKNLYR